jgi:holo-[acyl-carrier protein] synthase
MSVRAIGVDVCEVNRIARIIDEQGDRFLQKVFTEKEIEYCNKKHSKAECFAVRFAAKEAFLKALGTGLRDGLKWKDMEIDNDALGKPFFRLYDKCAEKTTGSQILLSMSHTESTAVAFVVIETT